MPPPVPSLPSVSSLDCAIALQRAGFAVATLTPERVVLRRGQRTVVLQRHRMIELAELLLILRSANVSAESFAELLAGGQAGGSGTRSRLSLEEHVEIPDKKTSR